MFLQNVSSLVYLIFLTLKNKKKILNFLSFLGLVNNETKLSETKLSETKLSETKLSETKLSGDIDYIWERVTYNAKSFIIQINHPGPGYPF